MVTLDSLMKAGSGEGVTDASSAPNLW